MQKYTTELAHLTNLLPEKLVDPSFQVNLSHIPRLERLRGSEKSLAHSEIIELDLLGSDLSRTKRLPPKTNQATMASSHLNVAALEKDVPVRKLKQQLLSLDIENKNLVRKVVTLEQRLSEQSAKPSKARLDDVQKKYFNALLKVELAQRETTKVQQKLSQEQHKHQGLQRDYEAGKMRLKGLQSVLRTKVSLDGFSEEVARGLRGEHISKNTRDILNAEVAD